MKTTKIAINGVGRIGRCLIREIISRRISDNNYPLELVAVNNPGDKATFAHLLQYDSIHGTFEHEVKLDG